MQNAKAAGGKPKRPMSAYNYYFRDKRKETALDAERRLLVDGETTTQSRKAALFSVVGRQVGQKWKNLPHSEKQPYIDMSNRDMKRYQAETMEYQLGQARKQMCLIKSAGKAGGSRIHLEKRTAHVQECGAVKPHELKLKAPGEKQGDDIQKPTGRPYVNIEKNNYPDMQSSDNFLKKQQAGRESQFACPTVEVSLPSSTASSHGLFHINNLANSPNAFQADSREGHGAGTYLSSPITLENVSEIPVGVASLPKSCDERVEQENFKRQNEIRTTVEGPGLFQANNPMLTLLPQLLSQHLETQVGHRASVSESSGLEIIIQMLLEQQQIRAENDRLRSLLREGVFEINQQQLRP